MSYVNQWSEPGEKSEREIELKALKIDLYRLLNGTGQCTRIIKVSRIDRWKVGEIVRVMHKTTPTPDEVSSWEWLSA